MIRQMPEADITNYTPEELARRCGCSLRHFSRLFRRQLGVSVRAKQTLLRLQKAAQMLCDSDAKISHIAREAGYRHVGLFYAMFKKQFGMTPSEWRERALQGHGKADPGGDRNSLVASLCLGLVCGSVAAGLIA
jgi:AraC-like DNA-binding protein